MPDAKPAKDPRDILEVLHDRFRQDDILGDDTNGHSQEQIRQDILDAFDNDRDLQVLAMFDESDAFLQSDWSSGSAVVESLRALMDNTDNRFKVVFAGLHNVQRFANRPNNPFHGVDSLVKSATCLSPNPAASESECGLLEGT